MTLKNVFRIKLSFFMRRVPIIVYKNRKHYLTFENIIALRKSIIQVLLVDCQEITYFSDFAPDRFDQTTNLRITDKPCMTACEITMKITAVSIKFTLPSKEYYSVILFSQRTRNFKRFDFGEKIAKSVHHPTAVPALVHSSFHSPRFNPRNVKVRNLH